MLPSTITEINLQLPKCFQTLLHCTSALVLASCQHENSWVCWLPKQLKTPSTQDRQHIKVRETHKAEASNKIKGFSYLNKFYFKQKNWKKEVAQEIKEAANEDAAYNSFWQAKPTCPPLTKVDETSEK